MKRRLKNFLRPVWRKFFLPSIRGYRRGILWLKRLDSFGAAALLLDKGPVYEMELTPDQLNGALYLRNNGLAYPEDRAAGGVVWRSTSRSRLQKWFTSEARRLGVDINSYEPKRADPPGATLIKVSDYPAPR